jgi:ankyrin repeat protein
VFCRRGDTAAATWLADRFTLTVHDVRDARASYIRALQLACENGHLTTAAWLVDRFGLTVDDVRAENDNALFGACAGGHLDVAQWLTGRFGLADADVCDMLLEACRNGHLEVVQWLVHRFALTGDDARARGDFAIWWACLNNHPAVARFLLAPPPVGLGATPPQAVAQTLFQEAARSGHHALVRVLAAHAGLDNAWLAMLAAQPQ